MDGHLSLLEKDYNDFKLHYDKQTVGKILIQRAVKATIQILYAKGFIDIFPNADKVLKDFSFLTRRRSDLLEINDDVTH